MAHHTITGCNVNPGDLMGSGTISGDVSTYKYFNLSIAVYLSNRVHCSDLNCKIIWTDTKRERHTHKMRREIHNIKEIRERRKQGWQQQNMLLSSFEYSFFSYSSVKYSCTIVNYYGNRPKWTKSVLDKFDP